MTNPGFRFDASAEMRSAHNMMYDSSYNYYGAADLSLYYNYGSASVWGAGAPASPYVGTNGYEIPGSVEHYEHMANVFKDYANKLRHCNTSVIGNGAHPAAAKQWGSWAHSHAGVAGCAGIMTPSKKEVVDHTKVPDDEKTTVMIRNLPTGYKLKDLLALLDSDPRLPRKRFRGKYDFVYLAFHFKTGAGLGYAFVNFINHEEAMAVKATLDGFTDWGVDSKKECLVEWATTFQGKDEHVEHYRNSPLMHDSVAKEHRPLLFENGKEVPFPAPTRRIRRPGPKHSAVGPLSGAGHGLSDGVFYRAY